MEEQNPTIANIQALCILALEYSDNMMPLSILHH